jgi:hypothetical protein
MLSGSLIAAMRLSSWSPAWLMQKQYGNAASVLRLTSALESSLVRTLELENAATYGKTDNPFRK